MNDIDVLIAIVVIAGAATGIIMGLFRSIVVFAALFLSIILTTNSYRQFALLVKGIFPSEDMVAIASFIFIFCVSFTLINILGLLIYDLITILKFGLVVDKFLGALLGAFGALLFVVLCSVLLTIYPFANSREIFKESKLLPYGLEATKFTFKLLPDEFANTIYKLYPDELY